MKNNGGFCEKHNEFESEFESDMNGQDNEQLKMFEGKLKSFKNCP